MCLKLDYYKACENLEWKFIFHMLEWIGFGSKFIYYVNILISNALIIVCVNRSLTYLIPLRISMMQGYPIAPDLYVLTYNALEYYKR